MKDNATGAPRALHDPMTIVQSMAARNPIFKHLAVEVRLAERGRSIFAVHLREDLTNTYGSAHGGVLFTLADLTFGFTCNAFGEKAVTASAAIDYIAPSVVGDTLVADAREVKRAGRNAYYDVEITNQRGETLALVRGRMRIVGGRVIED